MLSSVTIGQFYPGDSFLHRMDPRMKLVLLFVFMISIFVFSTWQAYVGLALFTALLVLFSGVPALMVVRSLRPLLWIILFTFVIHVFSHGGRELFTVWIFHATDEGVRQGAFLAVRLMLLLALASLLTLTTSPLRLTDALEALLSPLKRIGVPAHELAMMMTIALRFIPTLIEEAERIMKAQESRGADFRAGGIRARLGAFIPVLVPLFLSAFRRADDLALAMEARCYHGGEGRTQMRALVLHRLDYLCAAFTIVFLTLLFKFF